nr:BTB/POZ domain-containing protein At3g19850-like [Ipomoea batatas]
MTVAEVCDLQIHINGQQRFFLHEKVLSRFSGKLRKIIKQERRRTQAKNSRIDIDDFPGGAEGFELVSRFCYSSGEATRITVSNVSILHCCAVFLGMTEKVSPCNLLHQTQAFLEGMFYWSWLDILTSLKTCEPFFLYADSCGLIPKLINALLAKIAQNSDINVLFGSSSSSSSSPDTGKPGGLIRASPNSKNTPELVKPSKAWWFDDMTVLSPVTIEQFVKTLGAFGSENNSLVLTKFLLHYLKTVGQGKGVNSRSSLEYSGLADTAVYGVILMGTTAFSCRNIFWVLRILSGFGVSKDCRAGLESLIGGMLEQATLDDLLVCGHNGSVYDVSLVLRLIRLFVHHHNTKSSPHKMMKVGRLIDRYLGEISPDQSLKISRFLAIAESLPDEARDCFDGVYRAIDIYLESHPTLTFEERSRLCRCLNYEKLSLEACKDLAKNPRIPPRIAVQALASQCPNVPPAMDFVNETSSSATTQMVLYNKCESPTSGSFSEDQKSEELRLNLQRMQWRVVELEKVCKEMKGQMSKMVKTGVIIPPAHGRPLPRLC